MPISLLQRLRLLVDTATARSATPIRAQGASWTPAAAWHELQRLEERLEVLRADGPAHVCEHVALQRALLFVAVSRDAALDAFLETNAVKPTLLTEDQAARLSLREVLEQALVERETAGSGFGGTSVRVQERQQLAASGAAVWQRVKHNLQLQSQHAAGREAGRYGARYRLHLQVAALLHALLLEEVAPLAFADLHALPVLDDAWALDANLMRVLRRCLVEEPGAQADGAETHALVSDTYQRLTRAPDASPTVVAACGLNARQAALCRAQLMQCAPLFTSLLLSPVIGRTLWPSLSIVIGAAQASVAGSQVRVLHDTLADEAEPQPGCA